MLAHIAQSLLRHAIQFILDLNGEIIIPSDRRKPARYIAITREVIGQVRQCVRKRGVLQRPWTQAQEHPAGVLQTTFGKFPDTRQTLAKREITIRIRFVGRFQVQQNTGETLDNGVVDFTGHSAAFLQDRGSSGGFQPVVRTTRLHHIFSIKTALFCRSQGRPLNNALFHNE
jgi:hypothetical protein